MTTRAHACERELHAAQSHFMWKHIAEQPAAIGDTVERNRARLRRFAAMLVRREPVILTGLGSSLHAAMLGEYWLRNAGLPQVRAINSFELERFFPAPPAKSAVIAISHRGSRRFAGSGAGASAILRASICGEHERPAARTREHVFITTAQEKSSAHTKSVIAALAILHRLAAEVAELNGRGEIAAAMRREAGTLAERFRARIADPSAEQAAARRFKRARRVVVLGAGPNYPSALEAAPKLKETTFAHAEAIEVEQFLHGPIAAVDARTLAILISAGGVAAARIAAAARALREVGAGRLAVVTDADGRLAALADQTVHVQGHDESTSPFGVILSLQLFSYFSAVARGCNPDRNRREDARYARAARHYKP